MLKFSSLGLVVSLAIMAAPGLAKAETCDGYFATSRSISDLLTDAYKAMQDKDANEQAALLPKLEATLNALPAVEIKPETCDNHINAYTAYQYMELNLLREKDVDNGFSTTLPIVKQPDLNQAALAYAVGWIKYEQQDYEGALAAYGKGLVMTPHNHELQQEYLSTLVELGRYQDAVDFADKILTETFDLDDTSRGKVYAARGVALAGLDQKDDAKEAFTVAQKYNYSDDIKQLLDGLGG